LSTVGFSTGGYNNITLNADGLSWIQKGAGAITKFVLLSSRDISSTTPSELEYVYVKSNEAGAGYRPKFVVNYTEAPSNTAPTIGTGPSDGSSSTATPTVAGNNVAFTATATDGETDNYYLAICKTNAITANNNSAPTCATNQTWCVSASTASASQATCNYATTGANGGSNAWYAFACDYNSASACSSMSQGAGVTGSPFVVKASLRFKNSFLRFRNSYFRFIFR